MEYRIRAAVSTEYQTDTHDTRLILAEQLADDYQPSPRLPRPTETRAPLQIFSSRHPLRTRPVETCPTIQFYLLPCPVLRPILALTA